jgi:hypothetical protein
MPEHPVKSKLEIITRYTVSARHIKRGWFYILFSFYTWTSDLIVALAGIGIAHPLLTRAATASAQSPTPQAIPLTANSLLSYGVILAVVWVVLKVIVTRENGLKRGTLMSSCVTEMLSERSRLERHALQQADPMPVLEDIEKKLSAIYDRHNQEGSFPYLGGFAPGIDAEVKQEVENLYNSWQKRHGATWSGASAANANLREE